MSFIKNLKKKERVYIESEIICKWMLKINCVKDSFEKTYIKIISKSSTLIVI